MSNKSDTSHDGENHDKVETVKPTASPQPEVKDDKEKKEAAVAPRQPTPSLKDEVVCLGFDSPNKPIETVYLSRDLPNKTEKAVTNLEKGNSITGSSIDKNNR